MTLLVVFLEEPSAKAMLDGLLPRLLPRHVTFMCVVFEGKQDLDRGIGKKLKGWRTPETRFVVLRDKDSGDCRRIKQDLAAKCAAAGKPDTLVRIACHELESWYLGDLEAVEQAFDLSRLAERQRDRKFANPDGLANPVQELERLTGGRYQKLSGSRAIGPHLVTGRNRSTSFRVFVDGVLRVVA